MNCQRCKAPYSSTSNFCFHCGITLRAGNETEINEQQSKKIVNLLIILAIFFMGEAFLWVLMQSIDRFVHIGITGKIRPLFILISLCYSAIPMIVASVLPKESNSKSTLMVLGIIFCVIKVLWTLYTAIEFYSRIL